MDEKRRLWIKQEREGLNEDEIKRLAELEIESMSSYGNEDELPEKNWWELN